MHSISQLSCLAICLAALNRPSCEVPFFVVPAFWASSSSVIFSVPSESSLRSMARLLGPQVYPVSCFSAMKVTTLK